MIAFEVKVNGKRVCIAGADNLGVLSTIISAYGKLGPRSVPAHPNDDSNHIHYSVGGLTARPDPTNDVHLRWTAITPLKVGDVVEVKVLEVKQADRAKWRKKNKRKRE